MDPGIDRFAKSAGSVRHRREGTMWIMTFESCIQCAAPRAPGRFCGVCGQDHGVRRLQLGALVREFASETISLDRPWSRTLVRLLSGAGGLSRDFVRGVRVGIVGPLRFLIVALAVQVALNELVGWLVGSGEPPLPRWLPPLLLVLGLPLAFLVRVICDARRYDIAEVMVPVFYLMGVVALLLLPLGWLEYVVTVPWQIGIRLAVLMVLVPAYAAQTFARFVPCSWWRAVCAAYVAGGVGTLIVGSLARS